MRLPVAATVINFQTPDLLEVAVRSFHDVYPDVPVLIIDNGSQDDSRALIEMLCATLGSVVSAHYLPSNIYHGPAMHRALDMLTARYIYVFDSDTETQRGGFLEPMIGTIEALERGYGAGQRVMVDKRGFAASDGIPVLASYHMVLKRSTYHQLPPFIHHGLPVLKNFTAAAQQGYGVADFPITDYVNHLGRGTAARYGYGLGWRSRLDYVLHKLGL